MGPLHPDGVAGLFFAVVLSALIAPPIAWAQPAYPSPTLSATQDGGSRPIPDPTLLTTQAQERAIAALRELLEARSKALADENAWQTKEFDSAVARIVLRLDRIPEMIETRTIELQRLMEEKFKGVDQQFAGRDVALAAALLAQKTSVDDQNKANAASSAKAEGATTKQIDGIQSIIFANSKATDDKIDGVKSLLATQAKAVDDKIADLRNALSDLRTSTGVSNTALVARGAGQNDAWAYMIAGVGLLIGLLGILLPRLTAQTHHVEPTIVSPAVIPVQSQTGRRT